MRRTRHLKAILGLLVAFILLGAEQIQAQSLAETLEKGIYNEETTGNLEEAIKHYRQVLADAKKSESLAAQALFRLGRCLNKQGKSEEAQETLRRLIDRYPEQGALVEKARKLLPADLTLEPAPWKSGEQLTLTMMLPGGKPVGLIGTSVHAAQSNGTAVWNMDVRRYMAGGANSGVSRVVVNKETNLPIESAWDHTLLGKAKAKWEPNQIKIEQIVNGKPSSKTVKHEGPAYSNDQWMFGFRQLPLELGYKVTLPVRVAFTGGNPINLETTVAGKDSIETPVGTFDCFRLETNIQQTFWITDTPERYIARFVGGGVTAELTAIEYGESKALADDNLGYRFSNPAGWYHLRLQSNNPATRSSFHLVAPRSFAFTSIILRKKSLLTDKEQGSLDAWLDSAIDESKEHYGDSSERDASRKSTKLAGVDGKSTIFDFTQNGTEMSANPTLGYKGEKAIEVLMMAHREQLPASLKDKQSILSSLEVD